jgi:H+/gluconate symporter-like permease
MRVLLALVLALFFVISSASASVSAATAAAMSAATAAQLLFRSVPVPAQLPRTAFSILSYNILLPNSVDGWWTYKNYCPVTPMAARSWEARKRLLEQKIR